MKLLHIITGLGTGGAETMLLNLVSALDPWGDASEVISLSGGGPLGERLRSAGVPVRELGMSRGRFTAAKVALLTRWTRAVRPDLVQTWMYHADLLGGLAARLAGVPTIWGIQQGNLNPSFNRWSTLVTAAACAAMSEWLPSRIVVCSRSASSAHEEFGYSRERMAVIPNGIDACRFRPDLEARCSMREELGIGDSTPLVGLAARLDPQKDHATFFRAAGRVQSRRPDARFALCGAGIEPESAAVRRWMEEAKLGDKCHLLGRREDVHRFFAALDVAVLSSRGEGLPLAVGEAMASGVPCVVTDVGDAACLVGRTGIVVPPGDPEALANGISILLSESTETRRERGVAARERIEREFAIPVVAARYRDLYREVLDDVRADRLQ
jgi:glycosyltransferase involved in cell wall biosynthesis